MNRLRRASRWANHWMMTGAAGLLILAMVLAVANIALRPLGWPIDGAFELVGLGGALMAALALGASQQAKAHIAVDILFERFPGGVRRVFTAVSDLACAGFFALCGYKILLIALMMKATGEVSETLRFAYYPIVMCVALGFWALTLTLFLGALQSDSVDGKDVF